MRKPIIAGNWKMNKTAEQAEAFCRELLKNGSDCGNRVIIFVPYTDLSLCARLCENSFAAVGAQNVHWENSGIVCKGFVRRKNRGLERSYGRF